MTNVVRLPRPLLPPDPDRPGLVRECADPVHVFASVPGVCQCGTEMWEGELSVSDDGGGMLVAVLACAMSGALVGLCVGLLMGWWLL